jgi:hypothetical protein
MPCLKQRAQLLSKLDSATGLFSSFKRMRLKKEIREPFFICDIHMLEMLAKFKAEGLFDIPVEEE